jgi:hypothetical protein
LGGGEQAVLVAGDAQEPPATGDPDALARHLERRLRKVRVERLGRPEPGPASVGTTFTAVAKPSRFSGRFGRSGGSRADAPSGWSRRTAHGGSLASWERSQRERRRRGCLEAQRTLRRVDRRVGC